MEVTARPCSARQIPLLPSPSATACALRSGRRRGAKKAWMSGIPRTTGSAHVLVYSNISTFLIDDNPTESSVLILTMIHDGALADALVGLVLGLFGGAVSSSSCGGSCERNRRRHQAAVGQERSGPGWAVHRRRGRLVSTWMADGRRPCEDPRSPLTPRMAASPLARHWAGRSIFVVVVPATAAPLDRFERRGVELALQPFAAVLAGAHLVAAVVGADGEHRPSLLLQPRLQGLAGLPVAQRHAATRSGDRRG